MMSTLIRFAQLSRVAAVAAACAAGAAWAQSPLQVTELMVDTLSANDDAWEWIEVRNTSATAIDLNGAIFDRLGDEQFVNTSIDGALSANTVIPAGGVAVIYDGDHPLAAVDYNDGLFRTSWGLAPTVPLIAARNWPALTNSGGTALGLWADAIAYNADLANTDDDADLEVAGFANALLSLDFRTASGFPSAPSGVSITWNGQGDNTVGANWAATTSGVTSVAGTLAGTSNDARDVGNPGVYPTGAPGIGLIVTETMYNPRSADAAWEWVEVFNNTGAAIDFGATAGVFDDDDNAALTEANITSGTIPNQAGAILFNASATGVTISTMQAAWDPDGTRGLNFIPVTTWSTELGNSGDRFAVWPSLEAYTSEASTAQTTRTMENALGVGLYDDNVINVPGASGTWPAADGNGSVYLTSFDLNPTVGESWALANPDDGVSFNATGLEATITVHPGGELGTPGTFTVGPVTDDADFDGNSVVDGADLLIWQRNFGTGTTPGQGDANGSGTVDAADLAVWKAQFGSGGGGVGAVPEPASALLAMLAGLAAVCGGARRRG